MARANTKTLLPLDRYAEVMGIPLAAFNNLQQDGDNVAKYWTQPAHDELALYIAQSEDQLCNGVDSDNGLGFPIAPTEYSDRLLLTGDDAHWDRMTLTTYKRQVRAFGVYSYALVEADVSVSYASDTATITVTVPAGTANNEIRAYYRVADGADSEQAEAWRIRPLYVSVDGTTATITANQALFVVPDKRNDTSPLDYTDGANYVTAVDIYTRVIDGELPGTIAWDALDVGLTNDVADVVTQPAACLLLNNTLGRCRIRPATYADTVHTWTTPTYTQRPVYLLANYIAGMAYSNSAYERIHPMLETAAVRLANVLSPDFNHWLNDLAQTKWRKDRAVDENVALAPGEENSPFGFSRAGLHAFRVVRQLRVRNRSL